MQNNDEFKSRFAALLKRAGDKADLVVRKTAIQLGTSMVMRSPVDTGRFRANWVCSTAGLSFQTKQDTDRDGSDAIRGVTDAMEGWQVGQTIYLTNSLPYAKPLEYGHSKQAPQGMVRLTVAEFSQHIAKAAESVKA